jgi:2-polyprenyl-3-methyl-5-hydroxy-6-metoxy-1,4-benzoquinol methylase
MKEVQLQEQWPESWKLSYHYDLLEVFGSRDALAYSYGYFCRQKYTLDVMKKFVPAGSRILDVAAAQGNFSLRLAEQGYRVTWNDLRKELAEYVEMKRESGSVEYAPGNVFDLHFDRPFDAVLITEVIEHVAHPDEFLTTVARLVRPGGFIIMTTPNGAYFRNSLPKFSDCPNPEQFEAIQFKPNSDGHIFLLHPEEVETLSTRSGLVLRDLRLFTNPLTNGHLKTAMLLYLLPKFVVDMIERVTSTLPNTIGRHVNIQMAAVFERT